MVGGWVGWLVRSLDVFQRLMQQINASAPK